MKKLLVVALFLNAVLLAGRFWQELAVNAQGAGGIPPEQCRSDRTRHSIDSNADGAVDISDAVYLLSWLFGGGPEPRLCLAQKGGTLTPEQEAAISILHFDGDTLVIDAEKLQIKNGEGDVLIVQPLPPPTPGQLNLLRISDDGDGPEVKNLPTPLPTPGQLNLLRISDDGDGPEVKTLPTPLPTPGQLNLLRISDDGDGPVMQPMPLPPPTPGQLNLLRISDGGDGPVMQPIPLPPPTPEILSHMSLVDLPIDDLGNTAETIRISGVNLQIVNGMGTTATTGGRGNLIVGYNEDVRDRSGSHNIVVGRGHTYTRFGGLVAGLQNTISGDYASVSGGLRNVAAGNTASVSGGEDNQANGDRSFVAGGDSNIAGGEEASIVGGSLNGAPGIDATVTGGRLNTASGSQSSVNGGLDNTASGLSSSVSGGQNNVAGGDFSSVTGGQFNENLGDWSVITGGENARINTPNGICTGVGGACGFVE